MYHCRCSKNIDTWKWNGIENNRARHIQSPTPYSRQVIINPPANNLFAATGIFLCSITSNLRFPWTAGHETMKMRLCSIQGLAAQFVYPIKGRPPGFSCASQKRALPCSIDCRSSSYCREPYVPIHFKMYSSNATSHQPQPKAENEESQQAHRGKNSRSPSRRNSLRKVVIEAQRSRDDNLKKPAAPDPQIATKVRACALN